MSVAKVFRELQKYAGRFRVRPDRTIRASRMKQTPISGPVCPLLYLCRRAGKGKRWNNYNLTEFAETLGLTDREVDLRVTAADTNSP